MALIWSTKWMNMIKQCWQSLTLMRHHSPSITIMDHQYPLLSHYIVESFFDNHLAITNPTNLPNVYSPFSHHWPSFNYLLTIAQSSLTVISPSITIIETSLIHDSAITTIYLIFNLFWLLNMVTLQLPLYIQITLYSTHSAVIADLLPLMLVTSGMLRWTGGAVPCRSPVQSTRVGRDTCCRSEFLCDPKCLGVCRTWRAVKAGG